MGHNTKVGMHRKKRTDSPVHVLFETGPDSSDEEKSHSSGSPTEFAGLTELAAFVSELPCSKLIAHLEETAKVLQPLVKLQENSQNSQNREDLVRVFVGLGDLFDGLSLVREFVCARNTISVLDDQKRIWTLDLDIERVKRFGSVTFVGTRKSKLVNKQEFLLYFGSQSLFLQATGTIGTIGTFRLNSAVETRAETIYKEVEHKSRKLQSEYDSTSGLSRKLLFVLVDNIGLSAQAKKVKS